MTSASASVVDVSHQLPVGGTHKLYGRDVGVEGVRVGNAGMLDAVGSRVH